MKRLIYKIRTLVRYSNQSRTRGGTMNRGSARSCAVKHMEVARLAADICSYMAIHRHTWLLHHPRLTVKAGRKEGLDDSGVLSEWRLDRTPRHRELPHDAG